MEITYKPINDLIPYVNNARTHSEEQIAQIAASIREFGFTNPVLVDGDNGVIAGHGRIQAGRKLGLQEVPTIELGGMSETQKKAYILADNRLALNAGWDQDLLSVELKTLAEMGADLSILGFTEEELSLALQPPTQGLTDEDAVPEPPEEPISKPGDVWILGRHRLVCGDSTDISIIDKSLNGRKADLCLTDPPYGLGEKKKSGKNDYTDYDDTRENLEELAKGWLPLAREYCVNVVFSPGVTNQWIYPEPNWVICWFYGGGQLRSPWGFNCWQPFLCYGKDPSLASGKGGRPDAFDLNVPSNSGDINHPCPKPVKLFVKLIERLVFSPNAVLYEPFNGSGTTIIAAEKTGLAVAAIEQSPIYIDVAVKRWQDYTGKQAILEETGQTFDEVTHGNRPEANTDAA